MISRKDYETVARSLCECIDNTRLVEIAALDDASESESEHVEDCEMCGYMLGAAKECAAPAQQLA